MKKVDLEKSFFGDSQEDSLEFGADQCTIFGLWHLILYQHFPSRYTRAQRYRKGQIATKASRESHHVRPHVLASDISLIYDHRTLHESKGLEFNDVSIDFSHICLITDNTKVLLYNFFGDSTATLSQWRLVLNGISGGKGLSSAPAFDETRHASICVEVGYLRSEISLRLHPFHLGLTAEILVRRNYSGSEEPLDRG